MSLSQTTETDRYNRVLRSYKALGVLLERGQKAQMPAINWTVHEFGVYGEITAAGQRSAEEVRNAFTAWATLLGLPQTEHRTSVQTRLSAFDKQYEDLDDPQRRIWPRPVVGVTASIIHDDETTAGES